MHFIKANTLLFSYIKHKFKETIYVVLPSVKWSNRFCGSERVLIWWEQIHMVLWMLKVAAPCFKKIHFPVPAWNNVCYIRLFNTFYGIVNSTYMWHYIASLSRLIPESQIWCYSFLFLHVSLRSVFCSVTVSGADSEIWAGVGDPVNNFVNAEDAGKAWHRDHSCAVYSMAEGEEGALR